MIRDTLFRTAALADTLFKKTFPLWAVGIRSREEGKQWWRVANDGIVWNVAGSHPLPHTDHLEMSGLEISAIVSYGVDRSGRLRLYRHITWPRLRKWPNNTNGSFSYDFSGLTGPRIILNNQSLLLNRPASFTFNGVLSIQGMEKGIEWQRCLYPEPELPAFCERIQIRNVSTVPLQLRLSGSDTRVKVNKKKGQGTCFIVKRTCEHPDDVTLEPGASLTLDQVFSAVDADRPDSAPAEKTADSLAARRGLIERIDRSLVLETGNEKIDLAFRMAKLRASESIYRTKNGLMHGPGGGEYYAALWTNDQCEYVNPYFAWSGYGLGLEQAMNCYRLYAALMDRAGIHALPTSIIAEGDDLWAGAGDRGDAAMYAQGAGRFLLAAGRREWIEELLPAIDWCLDWCERHRLDGNGPVGSDSDELEGRFPSGAANLSTSVLYYDALISRAHLAHTLETLKDVDMLSSKADDMRRTIDSFFAANVEGFDTYRYFKDCEVLRSWICLPLTVGLNERAEGTLAALFSPRLWTSYGLRTASNTETVWDRSTLFALRGAFAAGAVEQAWQKLIEYSHPHLLGAHVPYPSEAYPEGNRRHLSAESGLYCRIFIEGLFGLRPTGLRAFDWTPRLPEALPGMALRRIAAFGAMDADGIGFLDLEVERTSDGHLQLRTLLGDSRHQSEPFFEKTIRAGETVHVVLSEREP